MDTVHFFDTTLRDGEQSPGFSMTREEKLALAKKLEALGVDVIEAGFPVASAGELDAVRAVAAAVRSTRVAALARARREDVEEPCSRSSRQRSRGFTCFWQLPIFICKRSCE